MAVASSAPVPFATQVADTELADLWRSLMVETLAAALVDSPAGLAAWLVEKYPDLERRT